MHPGPTKTCTRNLDDCRTSSSPRCRRRRSGGRCTREGACPPRSWRASRAYTRPGVHARAAHSHFIIWNTCCTPPRPCVDSGLSGDCGAGVVGRRLINLAGFCAQGRRNWSRGPQHRARRAPARSNLDEFFILSPVCAWIVQALLSAAPGSDLARSASFFRGVLQHGRRLHDRRR